MSARTDAATGPEPGEWWKRAVVYQIYPRSFQDSDGDGIGDLPGITRRLDHLELLGVDVVWLSPVYPSPMVDNGYDISDYRDIDPLFGTLEDMRALIEGAHERGIRIVMDLVVNHTSDQHPWFQESRDPSSPRRDWYHWRPARPGATPGTPGAEPDDSSAAFHPSAWHFDEASGEYYFAMFSPGQPDLNWENPAVRAAVHDLMRFWIDVGVDGFRMDVINLISKPEAFTRPGPIEPGAGDWRAIANGPRLDEFLAEMNREVGLHRLDLLTVGEMPDSTIEVAQRVTDPERRELNMVFTFEHMAIDQRADGDKWDVVELDLPALKRNLAAWQYGLAEAGWNSLYFGNHDQPRVVSRFGDDSPEHRVASAKALATVLHLHKGTPYVYQGDELGMTNHPFASIEDFADIESLNAYRRRTEAGQPEDAVLAALSTKGRDNARTPFQWDDTPGAGFTTGTPWLPANPNHVEINARAQVDDPDSVLHHYRRLVQLRHEDPTVQLGRFELLLPDHDRIWAFTRTLGDDCLLVLANCSSTETPVPLDEVPALDGASTVLVNDPSGDPAVLGPWEARVLRLAAPRGGRE